MSQTAATPSVKTGDRIRIVDAEPGAADPKALVYYDFYRNLTGTVVKAYDDGTIALSVDRGALPAEIRKRHEDSETLLRDKWLNGLSEEERNKLTQKEQRFSLKYTLLVSAKHVVPDNSEAPSSKSRTPTGGKAQPELSDQAPGRPSSADLDKAEEEYLRSKLGS